ncbi:MAG: 2Fe-2S iron-sulfur cluster binding domain-containing protein [Bacteroidia bacterium]|nr:2Fe-2S iron-sulfur cluster binding domain-containing protein [Bacteroidia bacterium]
MGHITFKFEEKHKEELTVDIDKGETILDIAIDNNISLHHNCGAVCACSTCHIYIEKGECLLTDMSDKEEDFVDRARYPKINSRLACQCELTEDGDLVVTIPDQSVMIGH